MKSYHPLTGWFVHNLEERVVLLRSSWSHYNVIANAEKHSYVTHKLALKDAYKNFTDNSSRNFKEAVEFNVQTNFLPLVKNNVTLSRFENQTLDTRHQSEPDVILNFRNSTFTDKRIHGLDQKSGKADAGFSTIYSSMSEHIYKAKLKNFRGRLFHFNDSSSLDVVGIRKTFLDLERTFNDLEQHQLVWAKNLHLFPNGFIPPMCVPSHFSLENASPQLLSAIQKAELKVTRISDYLYAKKVSTELKKPPEDLFQDSQLQKLLAESLY